MSYHIDKSVDKDGRPLDKDGKPISEGKEIDDIRDKVAAKKEAVEKRMKMAKELNDLYLDKDGNVCPKCQNKYQGVLVGQPDNKEDWVMGIRICQTCKIVEDYKTYPETDDKEVKDVGNALKKKSEDFLNDKK